MDPNTDPLDPDILTWAEILGNDFPTDLKQKFRALPHATQDAVIRASFKTAYTQFIDAVTLVTSPPAPN